MAASEPAKNHVRLVMAAVVDNVALARVTAAAFATQLDFTLEEIEDIRVAVSEAVTNAVIHAYGGRAGGADAAASGTSPVSGTVNIDLAHDGETLTITVSDHGRGIPDVALARRPAFTTDPERMGLGFAIMESFCDRLDVVSEVGRGTTVTMIKRPRAMTPRTEGAAGDAGT